MFSRLALPSSAGRPSKGQRSSRSHSTTSTSKPTPCDARAAGTHPASTRLKGSTELARPAADRASALVASACAEGYARLWRAHKAHAPPTVLRATTTAAKARWLLAASSAMTSTGSPAAARAHAQSAAVRDALTRGPLRGSASRQCRQLERYRRGGARSASRPRPARKASRKNTPARRPRRPSAPAPGGPRR